MSPQVSEIMTTDVATVGPHTSLREAARMMRDQDVGGIVVTEGTKLEGFLTDRDIAIRGVAESSDPDNTEVSDVASPHVRTLKPEDSISDAVTVMREAAVRRLPVVSDGSVVGIVSLGDLALSLDRQSALGDISAAPPNH